VQERIDRECKCWHLESDHEPLAGACHGANGRACGCDGFVHTVQGPLPLDLVPKGMHV
jgi:hypothetical protein